MNLVEVWPSACATFFSILLKNTLMKFFFFPFFVAFLFSYFFSNIFFQIHSFLLLLSGHTTTYKWQYILEVTTKCCFPHQLYHHHMVFWLFRVHKKIYKDIATSLQQLVVVAACFYLGGFFKGPYLSFFFFYLFFVL